MATNPPYTDLIRIRALVTRTAGIDPGTAGSVDEGKLNLAVSSAQNMIDAKLGNLYSVPFNPVPPLIVDIATALAAWDADLSYREVRDYSTDLNPVLLRYKWATDMLTDLQKGTATLPGYEPPDPDPGPSDNPNDPGSVVDVINPCVTYPRGYPYPPRDYYDWSHW